LEKEGDLSGSKETLVGFLLQLFGRKQLSGFDAIFAVFASSEAAILAANVLVWGMISPVKNALISCGFRVNDRV